MNYLFAPDCKGGEDCCSSDNKCKDGDGDCDSDSDCFSGKCGKNNCDYQTYPSFDFDDDCCLTGRGNLYYFSMTFHFCFTRKE